MENTLHFRGGDGVKWGETRNETNAKRLLRVSRHSHDEGVSSPAINRVPSRVSITATAVHNKYTSPSTLGVTTAGIHLPHVWLCKWVCSGLSIRSSPSNPDEWSILRTSCSIWCPGASLWWICPLSFGTNLCRRRKGKKQWLVIYFFFP